MSLGRRFGTFQNIIQYFDDSGKISYTEMDGFIRSLSEKEPNEEETLLVNQDLRLVLI